jgi:hypothetical protein
LIFGDKKATLGERVSARERFELFLEVLEEQIECKGISILSKKNKTPYKSYYESFA